MFIAVFACLCFCCFLDLFFQKKAWLLEKVLEMGKHKKFFPEAKSQSGSPQAENAVWIEKKAVIKS